MQSDNSSGTIQRLYDQDGLLDILLGVEQYFDGMDLYAYKNWIDGEIVEGPIVSKYWVEVTIKYNHETFPDPRALLIFERQGTKVLVKQEYEVHPIEHPRSSDDMQSVLGSYTSVQKPKEVREPILLVKFQIPRRLVNPESFDEYKLMNADFNNNALLNDDAEQDAPPAPEQQDNGDDIQFDEMGGMGE
ncbi:virion structural protein [Xanthomonas phage XaC1]|nr:virion structural protein [Xanthomonas phage XaC1]